MSFEGVVHSFVDPYSKDTKILYKFATRGRPEKFKKVLETYYQMMSGKNPFEFIISVDKDDSTMNNQNMISYLQSKPNLKFFFGESKTKIEAVNADIKGIYFDILVIVSDDMIPQIQGFDDIIVKHMNQYFPNMDGALHYNDGCCGQDKCITLSIIGRKLYEYFGYVYHPAYKSFYCDNEFTDEVRRLNKVVYIPQVIIKHVWSGGPSSSDALYRRNSQMGKEDATTYARRKMQGFPR